jgi:putative transposase
MNTQSRTFFVTSTTFNRAPIFRQERAARLFLNVMFAYRDDDLFLIHEFVLMPDHFHLIITPSEKLSLERALQRIKGGFSFRYGKEVNSKKEVWQRSFTLHHVTSRRDYEYHREYILQNPVRARLVERPDAYPYSSARAEFKMDVVPQFTAA